MTLVIDVVRALREPEYRDEISEELETDITALVMEEAANMIEKHREEQSQSPSRSPQPSPPTL